MHGADVIAFLRLRDGCTFKEACQQLGCWDEAPSPESIRKIEAQRQERQRQRELEQVRHAEAREQRLRLRNEVHTAARIQREACDRLTQLRQGAAPASASEEEECWAVLQLALNNLRDCEREYMAASGLECSE